MDTLNVKCVEKTKEIHLLKDKVQELLGTNTTLSNDRLKYENMYKEMKAKYEVDSDAQLKDISDKLF